MSYVAIVSLNISKYHIYVNHVFSFSVVVRKAGGLVGEGGSFAAVVSGAPSASLAESGASALPGLRALLGSLPVVGLGDGAVLVVGVGSSIGFPVGLPQGFAVIVSFTSSRDDGVSEADGRCGGIDFNKLLMVVFGTDEGDKHGDSGEFHVIINIIIINLIPLNLTN